jgi:hypothetical protein
MHRMFILRTVIMKRNLFAFAILGLTIGAHAQVAYSTLGQSTSGYGWYVGGNFYSPAEQFTSSATGALSSIDLVIGNNDGSTSPQDFQISLLSDNGGTPGATLGSWAESTDQAFSSYATQNYKTTGASLAAGQQYWLLLSGYNSDPNSCVRWAGTGDSTANVYDYNPVYGNLIGSADNSLYQVNVQSTPEPTSIAALGIGALGIFVRRKRK